MKRRMREQPGLGQAIDARTRQRGAQLEERDSLGMAGAAPLTSGGSTAGGGGVTTDPALPESFVTGLAGGSGNPLLAGDLTITGSGSAVVTQDAQNGEIDVHSPDYTAGDGLALVSEEFSVDSSVVRTSGNQSLGGLKTFTTLPQSALTPSADADLTTKDYVDERTKVVHRQVFPAAGSRDSVNGNNEINLPWGVSAFPSGATIPTMTIICQSDITFTSSDIGRLDGNHIEFSWDSDEFGSEVIKGAQIAVAASFPKLGSILHIRALLKVNIVQRFAGVYLTVNDDQQVIVPTSPTNLIDELSDDTWTRVEFVNLSIQNVSDTLAFVLTINGTDDNMNVGNTILQIRELEVTQFE